MVAGERLEPQVREGMRWPQPFPHKGHRDLQLLSGDQTSGLTGANGSAGRPQTMAHLDCEGTKWGFLFFCVPLRGTSGSCFCSAVPATPLNSVKDADIWDSAMGNPG